ncbi:Beta-galactosidase [compost metagenome]
MQFSKSFFLFSVAISFFAKSQESIPYLQKKGTATQLMVDKKPFLILGGELGNSSASSFQDIERDFPKLHKMQLNTVLVPAYWDLIEAGEGKYDFSLIDKSIEQARKNDLKVVFLWFGSYKNSMSCYAPLWFKKDYKKYPRAYSKGGKPLEIASSFSDNVLKADNKAFSELMKHIASVDKTQGTVIMVQVENEIGMLEGARDHSKEANKIFNAQVPENLIKFLNINKKDLHPSLLEKWGKQGFKTKGNWEEIFGADLYTDELFTAYSYGLYIEKLAKTSRSIYNLPLYVNAAMNSRNRQPGEYPAGGPLAHLIDIWHASAPTIDILAPDLYDGDFASWSAKYRLHNNPLFVPEIKMTQNNGVQAFYAFGEHDAIGYSPFSIENNSEAGSKRLADAYSKLKQLMPLLTKYQGKGASKGLLFDQKSPERIINYDDLKITARHFFSLPWDARSKDGSVWPEGGGLILRLAKDEYIVAGSGIVVEFEKETEKKIIQAKDLGEDGFATQGGKEKSQSVWNGGLRAGIGPVDEIGLDENGNFKYIRRLNGDQTHQGRHIRIGVDDFQILHVKLYEYQ